MPKLSYRFRVIFENFGVSTPRTELTKQVMDFKRPTASFAEIAVPIYNSTLYLAGNTPGLRSHANCVMMPRVL